MIASVDEVFDLLADGSSEARMRIRQDEARAEVWLEVLRAAPEHADAVVLNKALPPSVLSVLAQSVDSRVRFAVAQKKRVPAEILAQLAADSDEGVRLAVAEHRNTTVPTLQTLVTDSWERVRDVATRRLETSGP